MKNSILIYLRPPQDAIHSKEVPSGEGNKYTNLFPDSTFIVFSVSRISYRNSFFNLTLKCYAIYEFQHLVPTEEFERQLLYIWCEPINKKRNIFRRSAHTFFMGNAILVELFYCISIVTSTILRRVLIHFLGLS